LSKGGPREANLVFLGVAVGGWSEEEKKKQRVGCGRGETQSVGGGRLRECQNAITRFGGYFDAKMQKRLASL